MSESIAVAEVNITAPKFELLDIYGRLISLESYKGKKIFIGFFRHAGCPFCNLRVHTLSKYYEKFLEMNLHMIFFFESTQNVLLQSSFHKGTSPIPIISDPERVWYNIYGIEQSVSKSNYSHLTQFIQTAIKAKLNNLPLHMMAGKESYSTMPAEFLIDEMLIIRKIHHAQHLNDRLTAESIENFAKNP
ncbi:MAG: redoxin domain-containing protein [Cytophagales bacterium]|nr:redoxin domain-containing protein [Cytophagales bacterium]